MCTDQVQLQQLQLISSLACVRQLGHQMARCLGSGECLPLATLEINGDAEICHADIDDSVVRANQILVVVNR